MTAFQIPRNSLAWLLVAQAAVIAPHGLRLPLAIVLLCLICGLWRVMVYQGRWSYPGRWAKVLIVFLGINGVGWGYGTFLGLDPWVGLLVTAFVLKLLEMHNKRDAYIVILLAYFVSLTEFLYQQSIPYTIYMFFVVTMITAALIGLNQTRSHVRPFMTFKLASVLLLQSVPLMIVLFVLFPRLPPLWTVPLQMTTARSGISDTMTPGNIALLTQSDELAFRATFEGEVPPVRRLYWRALVLSEFDGKTWSRDSPGSRRNWMRAGNPPPRWASGIERFGNTVRYTIIMEPTQRRWMFGLTIPRPLDLDNVGLVREFYFTSLKDISQRLRYEVESDLDYRLDGELSDPLRKRYTALPFNNNPRSRRLATDMRGRVDSDLEYVTAVLRMFNEQAFVYTLKPPTLGQDTVDDFLLKTRRGFCEHFAGSFTFMMRAAGIPARVVVGYQGGEYNRIGDYVAVHQFDAHAWTEIWRPDFGWIRVDPTSAVAPERIERGLEDALESEFLSDVGLSWLKYRQTLWITELRLQVSAIAHYWDSWVVGYTPDMQMSLLTRYLGEVDRKRLGMLMLTVFFSLLGIIGIAVLRKRASTVLSVVDREYLKFCLQLDKIGLARLVGEGPRDYQTRIAELRPDLAESITVVTDVFVRQNYIVDVTTDARDLKTAIRAFRFRSLAVS